MQLNFCGEYFQDKKEAIQDLKLKINAFKAKNQLNVRISEIKKFTNEDGCSFCAIGIIGN